jgi:choline-sulfatase
MAAKPPNIVMIVADQMPARTVGAYGHPVVRTPHIDGLAERGVLFEQAYTTCPLCTPARASLATGRLSGDIGCYDNGAGFPADTPTFMSELRDAGYATVASGKLHFIGPDIHHGFERRLTPDIYPTDHSWTPDWSRGVYHNPGTGAGKLKRSGLCDWSDQLEYDEAVHEQSMAVLPELAAGDRPFLLFTSYTHPHDPFNITREWWDLYDHEAIDMPAAPAGDPHDYNEWVQLHHMIDVDPPGEAEIRNSRHAFYGMVSYVDSKVGELVAELERLGIADNTVVVFTSDHGEMLGEHGMWFKRTFYDGAVRVPLVVAGPGVATGRRCDSAASLADLMPTLLDVAGLDAPASDGLSLGPSLRGEEDRADRAAVIEYYAEGPVQPMRAIVCDGLKYVHVHDTPPDLLFDLRNDPLEERNCIDDPAYAVRLAELRARLLDDWDGAATRNDIVASQQRRLRIVEAMKPR